MKYVKPKGNPPKNWEVVIFDATSGQIFKKFRTHGAYAAFCVHLYTTRDKCSVLCNRISS